MINETGLVINKTYIPCLIDLFDCDVAFGILHSANCQLLNFGILLNEPSVCTNPATGL